MRVLVCGGRSYRNRELVNVVLDHSGATAIIEGGAKGADALAADWAIANGVPVHTFVADWHGHGPAAGPLRNQRMLDEGKPDKVVAFPGGRGTADMVRRAHKAGVEVFEVEVL